MTTAEVIRAAMELSATEREEVAQALLESIGGGADEPAVEAEWNSEINSRVADILSGKVKGLTREQLQGFLDDRRVVRGR